MELKIYNRSGEVKLVISPSEDSSCRDALQSDRVLGLSFTHNECVVLEVFDYADFCGNRYWIAEEYAPEQNSTFEWSYSCHFYGIETFAKNALMLKMVDGEDNPIFALTAPAREHIALLVDNLNRTMNTTDWKVGEVITTDNISIQYRGTDCLTALSDLAKQINTEYWFDGTTVNLCRCEYGEEIVLGYNNGLTSLTPSVVGNIPFFTRLFPIGSSRNIDSSHYGHTTLQLPNGAKFIEQNIDLGIVEYCEENAFADIYPRRIGTVTDVRSEEKTGADGNPFTIYYFKDSEMNFDPNAYEIGGLVKRISFQEGSELAGQGDDADHSFEVNYDSETKEFEIITIWPFDDDTQVPGGVLVPKVGDRYILWNIRMPDEYYALASQEFLEAAEAYMDEYAKDRRVFRASTDYVDVASRNLQLAVGQRVRLESDEFFPKIGSRLSRITSVTRKVCMPTDCTIEISDVIGLSSIEKIHSDITALRQVVQTNRAALPDIIRSWENTVPTDTNLFSARKVASDYLNRKTGGKVNGTLINDDLRSSDYDGGEGLTGSGFRIYRDANGDAVVVADKLVVRKEATFNELVINQISFSRGETIFTEGGCELIFVEEPDGESYFRCYYDNAGGSRYAGIKVGDQVRCQRYDAEYGAILKYYWRLCVGVGENYIDLSKTDFDGAGKPEAGDNCVQFGNRINKTRQAAIAIDPHNGGRIEIYNGIDSYTLSERNMAGIGVDATTGESYIYGYGDFAIGARHRDSEGAEYITYDQENGLRISGKFSVNSQFQQADGSYSPLSSYLNKLFQQNNEAFQEALDNLKKLVDGEIETWFSEGAPTLNNHPAEDWKTENEKERHSGDLYYDNETGTGYRFSKKDDGSWFWNVITDSAITKALAAAAAAQKTADEAKNEISAYEYIKQALLKGTTEISGGLILTSLIQLGINESDGYHIFSGINGIVDTSKKGNGIAAWYGGNMIDHEAEPSLIDYAQSLFRFDGSGYLAGGNIAWNADGSGFVGKDKSGNPVVKWDSSGVSLSNEIKLGTSSETLSSILEFMLKFNGMFELDTTSVPGKKVIKAKYDGLYTEGFLSALGVAPDSGSGGVVLATTLGELTNVSSLVDNTATADRVLYQAAGSGTWTTKLLSEIAAVGGVTSLSALNDVTLSSLASGQVLTYNGSRWVNQAPASVDMTNYVTLSTAQTITGEKTFQSSEYPIYINTVSAKEQSAMYFQINGTNKAFVGYVESFKGAALGVASGGRLGITYDNIPAYRKSSSGTLYTLLHNGNYASFLDAYYVKKSGDTMTGKLTTTALDIIPASGTAVFNMGYGGNCYIKANASGGRFLFCTNGVSGTVANSTLVLEERNGYPGTTNAGTWGTSANRWANVYTQLLNVSGAATLASTLTVPSIELTGAGITINNNGTNGFAIRCDAGALLISNNSNLELKPSTALNQQVSLGASTARWKTILSVGGDFSRNVTTQTLTVSSTSQEAHLSFSRNSANYIVATQSSGTLCFVPGGGSAASSGVAMCIRADKSIGINNGTSATSATLHVVGDIYASIGIWSSGYVSALGQNTSSDARLKDITGDVMLTVEQIAGAPSKLFRWTSNGQLAIGSIAQYWQQVLPHSVTTGRNGYLEMQYGNIALAAAISVARKVVNHEQRIAMLERENRQLRKKVERLKAA